VVHLSLVALLSLEIVVAVALFLLVVSLCIARVVHGTNQRANLVP